MESTKYIANLIPRPADIRSIVERLAELGPEDAVQVLETLRNELGMDEIEFKNQFKYMWKLWRRVNQAPPDVDWRAFVALAGRGFGKMLHNETPVPTPLGWTLLKNLKVGDQVFDESGNTCNVTWISDVALPDKAYRLWFADGTYLDACSEHLWYTWNHRERKAFLRSQYEISFKFPNNWPQWKVKRSYKSKNIQKYDIGPKVRTTQEIVNTFAQGKRQDLNHCIPNTLPLNLPDKNLPIPPYTLGAWLGDGASDDGSFSQHEDDAISLRFEIEKDGFKTTTYNDSQRFGTLKLRKLLANEKLLKNKHIPKMYLRASISQRLALLQGLMDTDGGVEGASFVSFCNTNKNLADGVYELVVSLGMKATREQRVPHYTYKDKKIAGKLAYRISYNPTMEVFRLNRKLERLKFNGNQSLRRFHKMISAYEEILPVPMQCIKVDSPNSTYLVGLGMTVTHNTRVGAEMVREWAESGEISRIGLIGPTASSVNGVMVSGVSGLLSVCPKENFPIWTPTNRTLKWPNGCIAEVFSAEEPDRLRGPQFEKAWADEICSWRRPETWDMLMFCLRLGSNPQVVVTTTPNPLPILLDLLKLPTTYTVVGTTYDNMSNLAPAFFDEVITKYEGSRLGRQELNAEILEEIPGALWSFINLDQYRISLNNANHFINSKGDEITLPDFLTVVLAIDPAVSVNAKSAETGMAVVAFGTDRHFYVLHLDSYKDSPESWARRAMSLMRTFECDKLVAEVNNGGDLVEANIKSVNPLQFVHKVHAARGKVIRAEPIASLYEQGKVHHVGIFKKAEDQMTAFSPLENPSGKVDTVDALVWGLTKLVDDYQTSHAYKPMVGGIRTKLTGYKVY